MTAIRMESLPRTFRDAVEITLRLYQNFLWIDSLCIIQDDTVDWEHEAALMAAIYGNSLLTIAATSSTNCESGCNLEASGLKIIESMATGFSGAASKYPAGSCVRVTFEPKEGLQLSAESKPPLHRRGWVLQESHLSPRILHMATHQMFWQCREGFEAEGVDAPFFSTYRSEHLSRAGFLWQHDEPLEDDIFRQGQRFWWHTAELYSRMEFTYPKDKLPAFAGIIQFQAARLADKPLLGLWEKWISWDLGWTHAEPQECRPSNAPTWSWLFSRATSIERPNSAIRLCDMPVLQASDIQWQGEPYVSKLVKSTISVKTRIFESTHNIVSGNKTGIEGHFYNSVIIPYIGPSHDREHTHLWYSSDIVMPNGTEPIKVTYMLLGISGLEPGISGLWPGTIHDPAGISFLTLLALPGKPHSYCRIGCGSAGIPFSRRWESQPPGMDAWNAWIGGFREYVLQTWEEATIHLY
jgi:hypothetical protein